MTNEEKKLAMNIVIQGLIDIAGGVAAVDIFKKATNSLQVKRGMVHSIGKYALAFGAFQIGMDLAEKGTKPFIDALFKVKLDAPKDESEDTEISKDVASEDTEASEDDISGTEDADSED